MKLQQAEQIIKQCTFQPNVEKRRSSNTIIIKNHLKTIKWTFQRGYIQKLSRNR